MTTKETPGIVNKPYGFGLGIGPDEFGHGGAYKTDMTVDTKYGLVIIFMVQKADDWPAGDERRIATPSTKKPIPCWQIRTSLDSAVCMRDRVSLQ